MKKAFASLLIFLVSSVAQANCDSKAVVSHDTLGAINLDAYALLAHAVDIKNAHAISKMKQEGAVWHIPQSSVVCVLQSSYMTYQAKIQVVVPGGSGGVAPPIPVWIDDRFLNLVN